ncbi:MAG: CDP-glucose 4,6-dehydratase [Verrucomicrobia bacterium]|nr:MAG: CDP-glucose 4,6-dehydratase [Verrucomicrobiota bacterium]
MSASSKSKTAGALFGGVYSGKNIFVTGHTGFKGAWLCEWLLSLGAKVTGYSLPPPTNPSLFAQTDLAKRITHIEADVRDSAKLATAVRDAQPDFIFHLAAQPLVRESYRTPVETYDTNVMGTIHLLEAAKTLAKPCALVCITTDKCYENKEWVYGYREEDPLGGYDPYSSSKAAAEIAIAAWRRSFFKEHPVKIASARAGNVIGGGDWAADRIVPDCVRALQKKEAISVRNKRATRPWQHVLEPLSGYLWLGARLSQLTAYNPQLCAAFNFGPGHDANRNVADLVEEVLKHWPGKWEDRSDPKAVHEANLLQLTTDKASALLGWAPCWGFTDSVRETIQWYHTAHTDSSTATLHRLTLRQIAEYEIAAARSGVAWAKG